MAQLVEHPALNRRASGSNPDERTNSEVWQSTVYCAGLENRKITQVVSWVRIPPLPPMFVYSVVALAQMAELWIVIPAVTGSSPVSHPRVHALIH